MRLRLSGILACATVGWALSWAHAATDSNFSLTPVASTATGPTSAPLVLSNSDSTLEANPARQAPDQVQPLRLELLDEPESIYPQSTAQEQPQINSGFVNFNLTVTYLTRYVFRGVDQTTTPGKSENALQFNGGAEFDLGKYPHPFIGLFVNVFNSDPVSRFEEVRPVLGLNWSLKPLTLIGTYTSYIFPDRKDLDTQEASLQASLDDSRLWNTDHPIFSPYILAAYDFGRYYGVYLEAGIKHDFPIEETGITITPSAAIAYTIDDKYFITTPGGTGTGAQHFEFDLTLNYSLNNVLNIPQSFGQWNLQGYLNYDGPIDAELKANTRLYGGAGLNFKY